MTRLRCSIALAVLVASLPGAARGQHPAGFDTFFDGSALRVDFLLVGDAASQEVVLDGLYRQPVWAGSRTRLVDPSALGGYGVRMADVTTGALLVERGFDSLFGEYRTTDEGRAGVRRAFRESVLVPAPRRPAHVTLEHRDRDGSVETLAAFVLDPTDSRIRSEPPLGEALVVEASSCTPVERCLDVAILGEGYTRDEAAAFRRDLARFAEVLLRAEPYASHRSSIAVRGVLVPSADSGADEPSYGRYASTSLAASFDSLGSPRYLLVHDTRALRGIAAHVPYDTILVMVNHDRYGGGGLYRRYATFTTGSPWAEYLMLHELGHSFTGLADEYYSSSVSYNDLYPRDREPVEPNITALLDPATLKWRDLVADDIPIPVPWDKQAFDAFDAAYQEERRRWHDRIAAASREGAQPERIAELRAAEEAHAAAHGRRVSEVLGASPWAGVVGAFEGAGYSSTGLYRPTLDCLMFSRGLKPLCPVCRRAVEREILAHTGGG